MLRDSERKEFWDFQESERKRVEDAEKLERQRVEAPIQEAEQRLQDTHRKLASELRKRLLVELVDPDPVVDPALNGVRMSEDDAYQFGKDQFTAYRRTHPEVSFTPWLIETLGKYFQRNKINLVSAVILEKTVSRFADAGLLPQPEAPVQQPEPASQTFDLPEARQQVPVPETFIGINPETGEREELSKRRVDKMTAAEFRRWKLVSEADLRLPNVGPGLNVRNHE